MNTFSMSLPLNSISFPMPQFDPPVDSIGTIMNIFPLSKNTGERNKAEKHKEIKFLIEKAFVFVRMISTGGSNWGIGKEILLRGRDIEKVFIQRLKGYHDL